MKLSKTQESILAAIVVGSILLWWPIGVAFGILVLITDVIYRKNKST